MVPEPGGPGGPLAPQYLADQLTLFKPGEGRPVVLSVPGMPWHTKILADQLTLFQPGGTDYAQLITTGTPGISDLPTALLCTVKPVQAK